MARQITDNPLTVTPARAADMLGIAPGKVRELIYSGQLPAFKIGRRWLIAVNSLHNWINEQVNKATSL